MMRFFSFLAMFFAGILLLGDIAFALDVNRKVAGEGLTVLHVRRDNLPMVVFALLVKGGSVHDPKGREGLANMTASLLEEGTKSRTSQEISEAIEFMGARYGASAGTDYTTLSFTVLRKDLRKGFDIFSDIFVNPTFPDSEVARVKGLVKGSLKQSEEYPSFLAQRAFLKEVYGEHPYSRIVAGTLESVDAIARDDVVNFHSEYYSPNNCILAVVGDISESDLEGLLKRYLGRWHSRTVPPLEVAPPEKPSMKVVTIDKDLTQANILLGHLGVKRENPDYYPLSVMNYILGGGGFSSRLMKTVRDEMGLAYDVHSSLSADKLSGSFEVEVQTKNSSANTVISEILRQMRLIREEKVSPEELEDAKSFLIGSYPRRFDTMSKIAGFLVHVEFFGLGLDYINNYPDIIRSVTSDDIQRVAQKYIDPENLVLVVVAKQAEAEIEEPSVPVGQ